MAGDEDDSPTGRHQRQGECGQPDLRVTIEPQGVAGVGVAFQLSEALQVLWDWSESWAEGESGGVWARGSRK